MAYRCGDCGEPKIEAVCHHCGRPLCEKHQVKIRDGAFSSTHRIAEAYHCGSCREKFHTTMIKF